MLRALLIFVGSTLGCSFESAGTSVGGDTSQGTDEGTTAGNTGAESGSTGTPTTATDSADSGSTSSSSAPSTGGSGESIGTTEDVTSSSTSTGNSATDATTGGVSCDPTPSFAEIHWAADASLAGGMQLAQSMVLPQNPMFAYSETAGQGTVTFEVEIPCEGEHWLWGLVWDRYDGSQNPGNADSFYWQVDGGDESVWAYGCQTSNLNDATWSWQGLRIYTNSCPGTGAVLSLAAGVHHITFRNRENGDFGELDVAGIAAIVIANASNHDPNGDYRP